MTKNKNLIKILILIILSIFTLNAAYSAGGLNVVLANQNPDPVAPGNFVELNVKISNSGNVGIQNAKIIFIENNNFQIAQGKDSSKELGIIPAYSSLDSATSYVMAKFLVEVAPNTPLGENPVEFSLETSEGTYSYEFDITVQDANPTLVVNDFKINTVEAGKSEKLIIEIENTNTITLNNVILSLGFETVENSALSTLNGASQKVISTLNPNEKKTIEFDILVSPDAESKPYLLPVNFDYEDTLGNSFNETVYGSVKVYSKPLPLVKLDAQDIYTKGKGKFTLAVSNPGTSTVKGTQIEILPSEDYTIIGGNFQYVGDLNPDDFQTVQMNIYLNNAEKATLLTKITYLDSYNNKNEEIVEIPLKIYTTKELTDFGIEIPKTSTQSYVGYFLTIVTLIIGFYVGRRYEKKKAKK